MTSIDQFARPQGWKILSWRPQWKGLLDHAFRTGNTLLIGIASETPPACNLAWLDESLQWCFISDLPYRESDGHLFKDWIDVKCGPATYSLCVDISLEGNTLTGRLTNIGDDEPGTFTAQNPPGDPPFWLRLFRALRKLLHLGP